MRLPNRPQGWLEIFDRREFASFSDALLACGNTGYESAELARAIVEKTRRYFANNANEVPPSGVLLAVASMAGRLSPLRVVDLGGAAGAHYYTFREILPPQIRLEWVIVETDAMVTAADALDLGPEVRFSTDLSASLRTWGSPPDLVLASGVLMYLPDPRAALEQISASSAAVVVFTRTGLSPDESTRYILQSSRLADNGPGPLPSGFRDQTIRYPSAFIPRSDFEEVLGRNHEIRFSGVEVQRAWRAGRHKISQFAYVAHSRAALARDPDGDA